MIKLALLFVTLGLCSSVYAADTYPASNDTINSANADADQFEPNFGFCYTPEAGGPTICCKIKNSRLACQ